MAVEKRQFQSSDGNTLAARFDRPDGPVRGYAIFAHCFTCTKDILAARRIAANLAKLGVAVLRFDFTGLGSSEGEFANTTFVSNVDDLVAAADHMAQNGESPDFLVGHSLGGTAVLAAAHRIPGIKGVATIGAPADAEHVLKNFGASLETIERDGEAEVSLAGRSFRIGKNFVDAARETVLHDCIAKLRADLLILHSPVDQTVGVENATQIFVAAKHPKSFVSLDRADHLLTNERDAAFAAGIISAWAQRLLPANEPLQPDDIEHVRVTETGDGKFQNIVQAGPHRFFADEPVSFGGTETGPSPYDLVAAGLGACTAMTLRMYADRKGMELGKVSVEVRHEKIHARDCAECNDERKALGGKIDRFERIITIEGGAAPEVADKVEEIANKCPVHRTLEASSQVSTTVKA